MFAREGYATIAVVLIFSLLVVWGASHLDHWFSYVLYTAVGLLSLLIIYFFRDPQRVSPEDPNLIISPADGKVVVIKEIEENTYLNVKATQISIFLSPLDVHVNRVPVAGDLEYVEYFPGKYLMAWEDHASEMNERAHFGVKHPSGMKFLFKQITGFLARRIEYHISEGEKVHLGQRFGIMKFGSRMDILIPDGVEIYAKEGDRTVAGITVIGRIGKA
jgi:phosphatidylserine decarboxylase